MLPWVIAALLGLLAAAGGLRLAAAGFRRSWSASRLHTAATLAGGLLLGGVALLAVRPYLGDRLVGAGDSYHYALQVADYLAQFRAGELPVLVGQSDYAFNGNVHTLRTAPYFTHLAGLLDLLSLQRLTFVQAQNLAAVLTALLAAGAAYWAALRLSGGRRLAAWLLAAGYVLTPAVTGTLMLQDMFATYMAAPWIMLCWTGLAGILEREDDRADQLLAAGSLGLAWLAHPPVAGWLTLVWGCVLGLRLLIAGGRSATWASALAAGLLLAAVSLYVFASVAPLGSRPLPPVLYHGYESTWARLWYELQQDFIPVFTNPGKAGIRLGGVTLLLGTASVAVMLWQRYRPGLLLALPAAGLLLYLFPVPVLSKPAWWLLPERLLTLSIWPAQRLAPLLAAAAVVGAAMAIRLLARRAPRWPYALACLVVAAVTGWLAAENLTIQRRPGYVRLTPDIYDPLFSPQNLLLTRYSYDLFERTPGYFSHSWMDPEAESRLFDRAFDLQDPLPALLAANPGEAVPLAPQIVRDLPGPADYLLVFSFAQPAAAGELTIRGAGIARAYTLPGNGEPLSFGTGPHQGRTIPVRFRDAGLHTITLGSSAPGVSVRILPLDRRKLPVELHGQDPYTATVRSAGEGFLETPRVWIPGYAATVNGRPVEIRRSANNLVMVPVPGGESAVVVTHPGPPFLRSAWFLSLASIALWPWLLARATTGRPAAVPAWPDRRHLGRGLATLWREHRRATLTVGALIALAGGILWAGARLWQDYTGYGSLRLTLEIPRHVIPRSEPLLITGQPGAADCLFIVYEEDGRIRLGLDHWGLGGPLSDPIRVDFTTPHRLEITLGSLYPASRWFRRPGPPGLAADGRARFRVMLDGQPVFDQPFPFHRAGVETVAFGRNTVGSTATGGLFSGRFIANERFVDSAPLLSGAPASP